jgi:hypothetical protein
MASRPAIGHLSRFALKLFFETGTGPRSDQVVPLFHRWIQTGATGELLIDVASYAHLHEGPSVILIGHEAQFAVDATGGRPGLQYSRRQPAQGPLPERLLAACRTLIGAASLFETDATLAPPARFLGNELEIVANDRLLAPNDEETFAALRAALDPLLARLYPGIPLAVTRNPDPHERLTVTIKAGEPLGLAALAGRIAG